MTFSNWLFWDVDQQSMDFDRNQRFIIERVLQRGDLNDWKKLKELYGKDEILRISKTLKNLDDKTVNLLAIQPETLELLKKLSGDLAINKLKFGFARDTSLALRLGHRKSIDLDFFTLSAFNNDDLQSQLRSFQPLLIHKSKNSLTLLIQGVKVEFIRHNYPLVQNVWQVEGIGFYSLKDIAAMKVNAIINRGLKKISLILMNF